jgi:hypothetical protein
MDRNFAYVLGWILRLCHILNSFRIFFAVSANPARLIVLSACIWSKVSFGQQGSRTLLPIGWRNFQIICQHMVIVHSYTVHGLNKTPAASLYQNPHVVSYGSKNRRFKVKNKLLAYLLH